MAKQRGLIDTVLATASGLLRMGGYWLLRGPMDHLGGVLSLPGLKRDVEVLRDHWGVPHIYAGALPDLMFAQGFVHAQDRLWQMDRNRRLVAGRLAEILGAQAVPVDRWMRILTLRRVAEQEVGLLSTEQRGYLEAYAAGVNARIDQGRLPIEFTLLRYRPEPWTVADSLSWSKMMSWSLSVNWEAEILRSHLIDRLGPERAAELEPAYFDSWPRIIPDDDGAPFTGGAALARAAAARMFTGPQAEAGLGSNNWVLGGSRTASGAPLLANDMHLPLSIPCIWYENHLVGGDLNVTGITFPGVPGVIVGHNGNVAWGFTNGFPDVQDLYFERLRRSREGRGSVQYEFEGQWLDAETHREEIQVRGGDPVTEEIIVTPHGPIINALSPELAGEHPLALRWTSLEPDTIVHAVFGMMRARDCLEFRESLRDWTAPVQNMVYADTKGNIGYSFAGKVPIRAKGDGRVPVPGWTGEYEWTGYIPFEELPHLYNPAQGYVATANNRVVDDDYPYPLGQEYLTGDRAQRIVELIQAQDKIDVAYTQRMHLDQVSPTARVIAEHLARLPVDGDGNTAGGGRPQKGVSSSGLPPLSAVVRIMDEWDGTLGADSPAAALYQVFMRSMVRGVLADRLGGLDLYYRGKGPTPVLQERSSFGERAWRWLRSILSEPKSHWFGEDGAGSRDGAMRQALGETVTYLAAELGPDPKDWAWGKLHTLTYAHTLGRVKPLDRLFNRGPYPLGGDGTTVWATSANYQDLDTEGMVGPPFRFIADLGDLRNSWGLLVPGQSGQPGSRHYDDQIAAWFIGAYHPMLYDREDVERGTRARLWLHPR